MQPWFGRGRRWMDPTCRVFYFFSAWPQRGMGWATGSVDRGPTEPFFMKRARFQFNPPSLKIA
jgi:hypothetical protein